MAKKSNKKITSKIRKRIIDLHLQEMSTCDISIQIFSEGLDLSTGTINKVIREYYEAIGEKRVRRVPERKKNETYTIEQIEEELIRQLKEGRPPNQVYIVAQKMNALTENVLKELKVYGYEFFVKEEEER